MSPDTIQIPAELLERYATSAPRYTSYPTAVDWKNDLLPAEVPELLRRAADVDDPCAVYVHIPFCEKLCLFCGCNVVITHDRQRARDYVEWLTREIRAVGASGIGRRPVTQYHWGGGTPTYLDLDQMRRLQDAFHEVFTLAEDAEVAIEVDPRVTTPEQLRYLGGEGFNRLSLGVQDFDSAVQKAVNRVQSVEMTREVVEAGRASGFRSVNVDLIYGLPYQTLGGFLHTVDVVLQELRPERVALFHYAHVPWLKKHHRVIPVEAAPSPAEKIEIFTRTVERFSEAGYEYLGLDHFARPDDELARARREGSLQRNFMGYGTRAGHDLVPLGVSAIGEIGGCFLQNHRVVADWRAAVESTGLGTARGHRLSAEDLLRRDVIMSLMCNSVVEKGAISSRHGVDFDSHFAEELAELVPLEADGLVRRLPERLELSERGQVLMRNVAVVFDVYFRERQRAGGEGDRTFSRTL